MKNLPNGFLAATVADWLEHEPGLTASDVARRLSVGETRAREIFDHAVEKATMRVLRRIPAPNHENQLKEIYR